MANIGRKDMDKDEEFLLKIETAIDKLSERAFELNMLNRAAEKAATKRLENHQSLISGARHS